MRALFIIGVAAAAGCYAPHAPTGAPCSPATASCPEGQMCTATGDAFACLEGPSADASALDDSTLPPTDVPSGGGPHWTLVQSATSSASLTTTVTIGSGHLIVVAFQTSSTNTIATVADDGGNTYVPAVRAISSSANIAIELWYATSTNPATTIVGAAQTIDAMVVWEVAGILSTNPFDGAAKLDNEPPSTAPLGASITTTAAGDFVVSAAVVANQISGIHAGNAFTNDQLAHGNGWAHLTSASAPAGTYQARWEQPISGAACASSAAFFVEP